MPSSDAKSPPKDTFSGGLLPAGPGLTSVELSHLEERLRDLSDDETLSREKRDRLSLFYNNKQNQLCLRLLTFDAEEKVRGYEKAVEHSNQALKLLRSEVAEELTVEVHTRDTSRSSEEGPDSPPDVHYGLSDDRIQTAEKELFDANAARKNAQFEFKKLSSNLSEYSIQNGEQSNDASIAKEWEQGRRWLAITPEHLRKGVEGLRHAFEHDGCWKSKQCTMMLCRFALHPDDARYVIPGKDEVAYKKYLLGLMGPEVEPDLLNSHHIPSEIFRSYLDLFEKALKVVIRFAFPKFLRIAEANGLLLDMHPVDWTERHLQILISEQKSSIRLWIQWVCGNDPADREPFNDDADIFGGKWRAPKFIYMRPAGNNPYDQASAWSVESLFRTHEMLNGRTKRLLDFLRIELQQIVRNTHVHLAEQGDPAIPRSGQRARQKEPLGPNEPPRSASDRPPTEWRALRDAFQSLADEELQFSPRNRSDEWLHANCDYKNSSSRYGLWMLGGGGHRGLRERFEVEATRAGIALNLGPEEEPMNIWFDYVFRELSSTGSNLLQVANKEGGYISRISEGSAICCARLEKHSLVGLNKLNLKIVTQQAPASNDPASTAPAKADEDSKAVRRRAVIRKVQDPQQYTVLSTKEAELYFEVGLRTIYRWVEEKKLKRGPRRGSITIESVNRWASLRARKRRS